MFRRVRAVPLSAAARRRVSAVLALLLGAASLALASTAYGAEQAAAAAADDAPTAAEVLLFETDHLAGVAAPSVLEYSFTWTGTAAFSDRVRLSFGGESPRRVEPDYLSGDHHVDYPAVRDAHGNPLLLYFLETDLREMQRQTGGQADYFRRLIRRALASPDLGLETVAVTVDGRSVPAQRIVVAPFLSDPSASKRYPVLKAKTYEFVLSSAVPGQIISLTTRVTGEGGALQQAQLVWSRLAVPSLDARNGTGAIVKQESQ